MNRILIVAAILALAACADQAAPRPVAINDQSSPSRIEIDQSTGAILFIVNGQEQARFDADSARFRSAVSEPSLILGEPYESQGKANE